MQRSLASLTPPEVLQVAISIEDRNAELYRHFADMFTEFGDQESLEIASVFWEMAVEERGHSGQLRGRYAELYGDLASGMTEQESVELIEVPKLDVGEVFGSAADGVPGRVRAMNVALQAEMGAQQFYRKLVQQTPPGLLCDIFVYLAQVEDDHVRYLQDKLARYKAVESSAP
ncbi:MAG TPA: ferritin family protein [Bryocella sp.]|nr:ferritin family protein [Bryocella sp.]